jgi:small subunit ribosomal protein S21
MVDEGSGSRPVRSEQAQAFSFHAAAAFRPCGEGQRQPTIGYPLQVLVRDNNVDQALRVLKKKMQREGVFREMKLRKAYEKPSERKARERADAVRRARKLARKQAIREGLIAAPKPKPRFATPRPGAPPRPAI